MSAYLIFTREKTLDEKELGTYSEEVPATLAGHEVKVLALRDAFLGRQPTVAPVISVSE